MFFLLLSTSNYTNTTHQQANYTLIRHLHASKDRSWNDHDRNTTGIDDTTRRCQIPFLSPARETRFLLGNRANAHQKYGTEQSEFPPAPRTRQHGRETSKFLNGRENSEFLNADPKTMLPNVRGFILFYSALIRCDGVWWCEGRTKGAVLILFILIN